MTTPNRPWPRISLRTVFVVMTVLGCWLGYELNWMHQRHRLIAKHQSNIEKWQGLPVEFRDLQLQAADVAINSRAPGALWMFGEDAIKSLTLYPLYLPGHYPQPPYPDEAYAKALVPEAKIYVSPTLQDW